MPMINRFAGRDGQRLLIEALRAQRIVRNEISTASELAKRAEILQLAADSTLIEQGASDNDVYFILSGQMRIMVHGRAIAFRNSGLHVGEMALIDPSARRAATVIASQDAVVARVSESDFSTIAERHPGLWRMLALELGDRLRQRNELVPPKNARPEMFIGSSSETLPIAKAIQSALVGEDIIVRVWTDQVFGASLFPIEDLESQIHYSDFAVLVLGPDDIVISRGSPSDAPRDNTIFELGLFMGALTRHRTFLVVPSGANLKIPTDILGLTTLQYNPGPPGDLPTLLAPTCDALRGIVAERRAK